MKSKFLIVFLAIIGQNLFGQEILPHNPGFFLGAKYLKMEEMGAPAFGLNYEYRFLDSDMNTGIGLNSELRFTEQVEIQFGPAFYIHPVKHLSLAVAPSLFYADFGNVSDDVNLSFFERNERTGEQFKFVLRFLATYDFPYNLLNISPSLGVDLIGNNYQAFFGVNISAPLDF
jgi:hypothetical protein